MRQFRVVLFIVALHAAQAYLPTMVSKAREVGWGNGISELVYAGVGCRVVVVDMHDVSSMALSEGIIASSERLAPSNVSNAAVTTLGVSLDGYTMVAATGDERLLALELVYEGRRMGQLKITAMKALEGVIVRVSDGVYDDTLGFEVYYVVTNHSVYCLRYDLGTVNIIASILLEPELRDVALFSSPSSQSKIVVSSSAGLHVLEKKGTVLVLNNTILSPGNGNDGFALVGTLAFVASRGDGLNVFDLGGSGSLLKTEALPDGAGWAGGVTARASSNRASNISSAWSSYFAVVASDSGIFGYQASVNSTNLLGTNPQIVMSLTWSLRLGENHSGCGWNIAMGDRQCKVYVSDKAAGLFVVDVCSSRKPTVVGSLQM